MKNSSTLPFLKMHGLGNDFVIIDGRVNNFEPTEIFLRAVGNRRHGVGCDQVIVLRKPHMAEADLHMAIYNSDGSQAGACGNATRCVADLLFAEQKSQKAVIETIAGLLHTWQTEQGDISVDFSEPKLSWDEIPLAKPVDTLNVSVSAGPLSMPCCVNMGNPHAVFFVEDINSIDLPVVGPKLETDPMFPKHCNIEIAQIVSTDRIRMRVWERGAGITEACGSGACAVLVAAVRRGICERRATVVLDGGELIIEWRGDNHVIMTGSASFSYSGELPANFGNEALSA